MLINHNISSIRACRNMMNSMNRASKAMQRISSGLRINSAADDPAGLAISEKMRAQIRGLQQASRNSQDGISMIQTAEGALNETHSMLQRLRELAVQASNDTCTDEDRKKIQIEINQLTSEINSIGNNTEFNTKKLLNSNGESSKVALQIGTNQGQAIILELDDMRAAALNISGSEDGTILSEDGKTTAKYTNKNGVTNNSGSTTKESALDVSNHENASSAIKIYDEAIKKVSSTRSRLGAYQSRLEHTINNLNNTAENLQAAESRIRDADIAKEMMIFAKNNLLTQVTQAMLVQIKKQDESIIQLLKSL